MNSVPDWLAYMPALPAATSMLGTEAEDVIADFGLSSGMVPLPVARQACGLGGRFRSSAQLEVDFICHSASLAAPHLYRDLIRWFFAETSDRPALISVVPFNVQSGHPEVLRWAMTSPSPETNRPWLFRYRDAIGFAFGLPRRTLRRLPLIVRRTPWADRGSLVQLAGYPSVTPHSSAARLQPQTFVFRTGRDDAGLLCREHFHVPAQVDFCSGQVLGLPGIVLGKFVSDYDPWWIVTLEITLSPDGEVVTSLMASQMMADVFLLTYPMEHRLMLKAGFFWPPAEMRVRCRPPRSPRPAWRLSITRVSRQGSAKGSEGGARPCHVYSLGYNSFKVLYTACLPFKATTHYRILFVRM